MACLYHVLESPQSSGIHTEVVTEIVRGIGDGGLQENSLFHKNQGRFTYKFTETMAACIRLVQVLARQNLSRTKEWA